MSVHSNVYLFKTTVPELTLQMFVVQCSFSTNYSLQNVCLRTASKRSAVQDFSFIQIFEDLVVKPESTFSGLEPLRQ